MNSVEIPCEICCIGFPLDKIEYHQTLCYEKEQEKKKSNAQTVLETPIYNEPILTETQIKAITYVNKKSKIFSSSVKLLLVKRFLDMDYTKKDFEIVHKFIKNAPIIIHFHPKKMIEFLIKDTHYRNLFETNTSSGSTSTTCRTKWENTLFNNLYDISDPHNRVKYGVVNLDHNKSGCNRAQSYGDSYIQLKNEMKNRTSFTYGDSSSQDIHICTFKGFYNMLYYIPQNCLKCVIDTALNKQHNGTLNNMSYIESQYHGPVRLKCDIEQLIIHSKYKNDDALINKLNQFSYIHGVPWKFMEST